MADKIPEADHHEVCKYEDNLSQGFRMVLKRLQVLQQALKSRTRTHSGQAPRGENSSSEAAQSTLAQQTSEDGIKNN